MSFIELDLHKIVVATCYRGLKRAGNVIKGKPPFQVATIVVQKKILTSLQKKGKCGILQLTRNHS
jgi:hypothetical protein